MQATGATPEATGATTEAQKQKQKTYSLLSEDRLTFYRSVEATEAMKQKLPSTNRSDLTPSEIP